MNAKDRPTFGSFLIAVGGLLVISGVGTGLVVLAFLFPLEAAMFIGACGSCVALGMGVRFVNRILDPRDGRRPSERP